MRRTWGAIVAILSVSACASAPPPRAIPEVPMYTTAEWVDMHRETTVPEIADSRFVGVGGGLGSFGGVHVHMHGHMHAH